MCFAKPVCGLCAVTVTYRGTFSTGLREMSFMLSQALDCLKCQILEGMDATDIRALVLDMQARLLMEFLRKSLDAALINPSTLIAEPWQGTPEVLAGFGPDGMAVDAALVPSIQVCLARTCSFTLCLLD